MDSRDASIHNRQGITTYAYQHQHLHTNNNPLPPSNFIPTNPAYAFNSSLSAPFDSALLAPQQQQQQQNGSSSAAALEAEQPDKRRRGRPRKYSPDATGLVLSSNSQGASVASAGTGSVKKEIGGRVNEEGNQGRRQRGRPSGSGKKQLDALGGVAGSGFTPHVIKVFPKEDVVSKMNEFCQEGPRTITILSAYGAVFNATIQQPGSTDECGTLCCEGYSDIMHLAGPFFYVNCDESRGNKFDLIVLLMGSDGKSLGGRVVGKLIAATTIQIIAGSYIDERKKSNGSVPPVSLPLSTPVSRMLAFGGQSTGYGTAPMEAASDSSDDNGATGSHSLSQSRKPYTNTNYPMHSYPMYQQHMGWGSTGSGDVHHNNNNGK